MSGVGLDRADHGAAVRLKTLKRLCLRTHDLWEPASVSGFDLDVVELESAVLLSLTQPFSAAVVG